jgi:hypothetical protein
MRWDYDEAWITATTTFNQFGMQEKTSLQMGIILGLKTEDDSLGTLAILSHMR